MKTENNKSAKLAQEIGARMDAVERLTQLFKIERIVYLGVTCISLITLLISAGSLLFRGQAGVLELAGLFGSTGLITYSTSRLLVMWNQALKLLAGDTTGGKQ